MAYVTIIAMLALIEYQYFGIMVGAARGRGGVEAPAVSGDPTFERAFRAHQNTLEQLVVFLPALYASAYFVSDTYAVLGGVVFMTGRAIYFRAYMAAAEKRGPGMVVTMIGNVALVLGGLIGALLTIF
jgi:uncharacterized MAPEG superfamily protein